MADYYTKRWFFQKISMDAFKIFSVTFIVLLLMEIVKNGIVSNYISLPHAAFVLLLLAILSLSLQDNIDLMKEKYFSRIDYIWLGGITLVVCFVIILIMGQQGILTPIVVFVTILTLWCGTFKMKN